MAADNFGKSQQTFALIGHSLSQMPAAPDATFGVPSVFFKSNKCLSKDCESPGFPQLSASIRAVSASICVSSVPVVLSFCCSVVPVVPVAPPVSVRFFPDVVAVS